MDILYKLLTCYNKSNYEIGNHLLISRSLDVAFATHQGVGYKNNWLLCLSQDRVVLALWETSVNLPPNYVVLGLLLAIVMASCIPFAFGIVYGLGFQALESAFFNAALLNETQKASSGRSFSLAFKMELLHAKQLANYFQFCS
eukprot:TsM_000383100 transcript=TsM_000383100 gene=TsM_000383100